MQIQVRRDCRDCGAESKDRTPRRPVRRSLFYGSCGYLDSRGYLDLNIFIRTLLMGAQPQTETVGSPVWGQVGAGIVADSDPMREWSESLQKAKAQLLALGL